ncbi:DUF4446 family protein [Streptomonospora nanhaiensis]|uniref:DUF4446 domain-containing protein n=2 Tax=Streptomonospora nanhaiensis TaxID=1323731 RepID=A0A853BRK6_9ACTN|nr:DUF4446 family protein [Streptomonospora nanhaiensis]NYI97187.1 hypothetical protein [Streptomonospora nanhaiensis]
MTTSLVVVGVLAGLGGLAVGTYAFLTARSSIEDCRSMIERMLPDGSGVDARALRDVAVVRYDALEEMSGARSFSLALLNAVGDGVVVTSINGRTESRTYAKAIEKGRALEALSPEEYRAIRAARLGQAPSEVAGEDAPAAATAPRKVPGARVPQPAPAEPSAGPAVSPPAPEAPPEPAADQPAVRTLGAAPGAAPVRKAQGAAN